MYEYVERDTRIIKKIDNNNKKSNTQDTHYD